MPFSRILRSAASFVALGFFSVMIFLIAFVVWHLLNQFFWPRPNKAILSDFIPIGIAVFLVSFICGSGIFFQRYWWIPSSLIWGFVTLSVAKLRVNPGRNPDWWWDYGSGWMSLFAGMIGIALVSLFKFKSTRTSGSKKGD